MVYPVGKPQYPILYIVALLCSYLALPFALLTFVRGIHVITIRLAGLAKGFAHYTHV